MKRIQLTDDGARDIAAVLAWAADMLMVNANDIRDGDDPDPSLEAQLRRQSETARRVSARITN